MEVVITMEDVCEAHSPKSEIMEKNCEKNFVQSKLSRVIKVPFWQDLKYHFYQMLSLYL